ncbi:hypothetical protein [Poseidonibacter sp.]|uniref:hypothetical protein n=1 Tax=Poseidonibacter sp. TaxID=2321188 RepID=UPI003C7714AD
MNKLPSRDDEIYEEIESFEDYEFTNCIVFEMAIRVNNDYHIVSNKSNVYKIDKIKLSDINLFGFQNLLQVVDKIYPTYIKETNERAFDIYFEDLLLKKQEEVGYLDKEDFTNTNLKKTYKQAFNQGKRFYINEILNDLEYFIKYFLNNETIVFNDIYVPSLLDKTLLNKNNCKSIIREQKILRKIQLPHSRPNCNFNIQKSCLLEVNLSLPKKELLSYISKIKEDYDKNNSIIKSPLELLGEDLEKSSAKISKKLIADKFFVYDYVKVRQSQITKLNESIYKDYKEKIQVIKNNTFINGRDKTIQIKEVKEELKQNIINTKIDDIFHEFEEMKDFKSAKTASRYFYEIKPFIDDCKYKELITGTSSA